MPSFSNLVPWFAPYAKHLVDVAQQAGLRPVLTSTYRSTADQSRLYARRSKNPYPVAPPGSSPHHTGLAFDLTLALVESEKHAGLAALGDYWKRMGGRWGGDFKHYDPVHFDVISWGPPYEWEG